MGKQHLAEQHQLPYTYDDIEEPITAKFCKELVIGIDAMWKELVEKFNFLLGEVDNAFGIIHISGESDVSADQPHDTVEFVEGSDVVITTNPTTSKVTFAIPAEPSHIHDGRYYTETELDGGQLDNRYFRENEHLDVSAGAGDAGKPIKLDAGGKVDDTMISEVSVTQHEGAIDHGSIGGLGDDDHTQYLLANGNRVLADHLYIYGNSPYITMKDTDYAGGNDYFHLGVNSNVIAFQYYDATETADIDFLTINGELGTIDVANSEMVLDEDNMASDSATQLATQQSIKAYFDNNTTNLQRIHLKKSAQGETILEGVGNEVEVGWDVEEYKDAGAFSHSTSSSNDEITAVDVGIYRITANITWENATGSARDTLVAYVKINGSAVASTRVYGYDRGSTYGIYNNCLISTTISLDASDVITIGCYGVNIDGSVTLTETDCELIIEKLATEAVSNTWRAIHDTPANGATTTSISSNWAYDHGNDATIHFLEGSIDHGSIAGLADDDHTQYILADGSRAFSGNVVVNSNVIKISSTFPNLQLWDTDAADPNDYARIVKNSNNLVFGIYDDSLGSIVNLLSMDVAGDISVGSSAIVVDEDNMVSDSATKVCTQQSIKAYVDNEISGLAGIGEGSFPGFLVRSRFEYKDADEIYIDGGVYHHQGTAEQFVFWDSQITFQIGSGGSNSDSDDAGTSQWHYLYIDDSAVVTLGSSELTASEFLNSTEEPVWNASKKGWYGPGTSTTETTDRCIFAFYIDGSGNILSFYHDDNLVEYEEDWESLAATSGIDASWGTTVTLDVPSFCNRCLATFHNYRTGSSSGTTYTFYYRVKGSSGSGHKIGTAFQRSSVPEEWRNVNRASIFMDSNYQIEIAYSAASADAEVYTNGFYLPIGL